MDVHLPMKRRLLSKCISVRLMLIFIRGLALALVVPAPLQPKVCPLWAGRKWQQMLNSPQDLYVCMYGMQCHVT